MKDSEEMEKGQASAEPVHESHKAPMKTDSLCKGNAKDESNEKDAKEKGDEAGEKGEEEEEVKGKCKEAKKIYETSFTQTPSWLYKVPSTSSPSPPAAGSSSTGPSTLHNADTTASTSTAIELFKAILPSSRSAAAATPAKDLTVDGRHTVETQTPEWPPVRGHSASGWIPVDFEGAADERGRGVGADWVGDGVGDGRRVFVERGRVVVRNRVTMEEFEERLRWEGSMEVHDGGGGMDLGAGRSELEEKGRRALQNSRESEEEKRGWGGGVGGSGSGDGWVVCDGDGGGERGDELDEDMELVSSALQRMKRMAVYAHDDDCRHGMGGQIKKKKNASENTQRSQNKEFEAMFRALNELGGENGDGLGGMDCTSGGGVDADGGVGDGDDLLPLARDGDGTGAVKAAETKEERRDR
ncbi:hypothetical protein HDU97_008680 [Phlyctochytrium planicorne]|nr:hypothetical protein HDU97_008680 [Phlyctochytrium planicorne]